MYKIYFILAIVSTISFVQSHIELKGLTAKELEELEDKLLHECREQFNVDKSVVEEYYEQDKGVPNTQEFKKVLGCYAEKIDFLTDNNKVNWDRVKLATHIYHKDNAQELEKALNIMDECEKQEKQHSDRNEVSYDLAKCTKEGYQKAKLEW